LGIAFSFIITWWAVIILLLASIVWICSIVVAVVCLIGGISGKGAVDGASEENRTYYLRTYTKK